METVILTETYFGVEVRCAQCNALLDRVSDKRVAYWRCEQYRGHGSGCSAASITPPAPKSNAATAGR